MTTQQTKPIADQAGGVPQWQRVVLAWMMQRQHPMIPIFSGGKPEHLRENLGAVDITLSEAQMTQLMMAGYCPNEEREQNKLLCYLGELRIQNMIENQQR